ncbi:MAG: GNAT family N-acetyltransferase [Thermomicrobiales bacterium]
MSRHINQTHADVLYLPFTADQRDALINFVAADTYPFNGVPAPTREDVASWIDKGIYTETFWITLDGTTRVGVVQYQDASPIRAEVHIRLHRPYRGQGIGTHAITWLTNYLFQTFPAKHRVEGWTRIDNITMRRVFRNCGYVKEAHLRLDFPTDDGTYRDKIGYGILRDDWRTGNITSVMWHDEEDEVGA